jgi:hypothetical protein
VRHRSYKAVSASFAAWQLATGTTTMQREPVFDAAATLPGWSGAVPQDTDTAVDGRMAWIGGGLSLLMWAVMTALAVDWF